MRFWDGSAFVPLVVQEPASGTMAGVLARDPGFLVWWAAPVGIGSALARLERESALPVAVARRARRRLDALAEAWHEIRPTDAVRAEAVRLLRLHPLRAMDALQLAAALTAARALGGPEALPFVCLDHRLSEAAAREGFRVEPEAV